MVTQQIRKVGNSYVVTIPKAEIERLGAQEGDYISGEYTLMEMRPVLSKEMQDYEDRNKDGLVAMMKYLRDK